MKPDGPSFKSNGFSRRDLLGLTGALGAGWLAGTVTSRTFAKKQAPSDSTTTDDQLSYGESSTALGLQMTSSRHSLSGHPESHLRVQAIHDQILLEQKNGSIGAFGKSAARAASVEELVSFHTPEFVRQVLSSTKEGGYFSSSKWSPYTGPNAFPVAAESCGLLIDMVQSVRSEKFKRGLALTRPPGHHATSSSAMGYCIFNSIAVATKVSQSKQPGRIAIVDLDVHHGNGIQDAFYSDPNVLYISAHQDAWPHSGNIDAIGEGAGRGFNINIPLPAGVGDEAIKNVFEQITRPALKRFKPDAILVAMGFDTHWRDFQGSFSLSLGGIASLTKSLNETADALCGGKIVYALEGGYHLQTLAAGATNLLKQLTESRSDLLDPIGPFVGETVSAEAVIKKVRRLHKL